MGSASGKSRDDEQVLCFLMRKSRFRVKLKLSNG